MPQLIGGEYLLGVAQQPQPVSLPPKRRQGLQDMGIQPDIVQGGDPEQLGGVCSQALGVGMDALVPEQLGHHLFEGDVREAFVALARPGLPVGHGLFKGAFQLRPRVAGPVEAKVHGGFLPDPVILLGVDIHQGAVKIKNQIGIAHIPLLHPPAPPKPRAGFSLL